jgi:hypothetical protein
VAVVAGATVVAGAAAAAVERRRRRDLAAVADDRPRAAQALAGDVDAVDAPTDDQAVAAWARAVAGRTPAAGDPALPADGAVAAGSDEGVAQGQVGAMPLPLAVETTPIGELSVADVADAVRQAWGVDGNGREPAPGLPGRVADSDAASSSTSAFDTSREGRGAELPRRRPPPPAAASRRRPWAIVVGVVALVLVIGLGIGLVGGGGDGGDTDDVETASEPDEPVPPSQETTVPTTVPAQVTAAQVFPLTADRLVAAGSFSYAGTVSATDVSHVRPMLWLSVESTVEGQVALTTGRVHEIAVDVDGRAVETVTDGPQVLARRADARDALAAVPYQVVPALSGEGPPARGTALLPTWLAAAVGPSDAGLDESGRRRFTATIPAAVFGQIEREREPVDATVVLTVDAMGAPTRVEITSSPAGPPLRLVFDLMALGAPVDIQPPA